VQSGDVRLTGTLGRAWRNHAGPVTVRPSLADSRVESPGRPGQTAGPPPARFSLNRDLGTASAGVDVDDSAEMGHLPLAFPRAVSLASFLAQQLRRCERSSRRRVPNGRGS